jgi:hypothetical protein
MNPHITHSKQNDAKHTRAKSDTSPGSKTLCAILPTSIRNHEMNKE